MPMEYHGHTWGWLVSELFRKIHPSSIFFTDWFIEHVTDPLKADVHLTVPVDVRVVDVKPRRRFPGFLSVVEEMMMRKFNALWLAEEFSLTDQQLKQARYDPFQFFYDYNNHPQRRAGEQLFECHASARGIAKVCAAMAGGGTLGEVTILSKDGWDKLHANPKEQQVTSYKIFRINANSL